MNPSVGSDCISVNVAEPDQQRHDIAFTFAPRDLMQILPKVIEPHQVSIETNHLRC